MFYDIYLGSCCSKLPSFQDLADRIPQLNDPLFINTFVDASQDPGFLGLNLSEELAREVYVRCRTLNASGDWLPAAYRQPLVTKEQAFLIAEKYFQELNTTEYQNDPLEPPFMQRPWPRLWVFGAASETMKKSGLVPGCLSVSIDKVDGHIWTDEEFMAIARKQDEVDNKIWGSYEDLK